MNDHITGEDLAAYVDGVLQGAPRAEIESHLSRCPECLAALAEIVDIQGSAVKVPGEFLRRALMAAAEVPESSRKGSAQKVIAEGILGEKSSPGKAVPPMRLGFGIAAVFLVAVLTGYYFLDRGRRETAGIAEKEMPRPAVAAKDHRSPTPAAGTGKARRETAERTFPAQEAQAEAANGLRMEKKSSAGAAQSVQPAAPPEKRMAEPAPLPEKAERPQTVDAKDLALSREAEGGAVGGVLGGVEASMDKDKENAGKLAVASAAASKDGAIEERMPPRSRLSGSRAFAGAMQ
ncbi:MAG TPA: zf-HC2 domain-containing protein, partial [Acidobacteriota bacterium]